MATPDAFRKMALSFEDTDEHPHFNRRAFRVRKKIFATLHLEEKRGMVILSPVEQSIYCDYDGSVFYPASGSWGQKGSTLIELGKVKTAILKEALQTAYNGIAAKHPAKKKTK